jgi:hypothetical protein
MQKHWSVDTTELQKDPDAHAIWTLEQAINFGIRDRQISRELLTKYWDRLDLDPVKKKYLAFLLGHATV